LLKYVFS
jgi:cathepsin B